MGFDELISYGDITIEEGVVTGRNLVKTDLTEALGAANVNGPPGDKGQYVWDGSYKVILERGMHLDRVYSSDLFGITGQDVRGCFAKNEKVTVIWMNRKNSQIPIILNGVTIDSYLKQMVGMGHLLDQGEYVIRSAMSNDPETSSVVGKPFADNQFDQKATAPNSNENIDKVVKNPGGETFYDKFGRVCFISRQPYHEFMVTVGKTDSGQDDVSNLTTVADQDVYYAKITNDESDTTTEPFKPKEINLSQYQQTVESFVDGSDGTLHKRGILPRFDKWIFKPIVVRKYALNSDGAAAYTTDIYAVYQERGELFVRTITSKGDLKEYIDGYINQRIKGDCLLSIGGSLDLKIKTTDRDANGASTPNLAHFEALADGTVRLRVNENAQFKGTFDQKISPDGTLELYGKTGGATSTDYNVKIKLSPDGTIEVDSKKKIVVHSDADIYIGGETDAEPIPLGTKLKSYLDSFMASVFRNWVPVPSDGGASLKTLFSTWDGVHSTDNYLSSSRKVN